MNNKFDWNRFCKVVNKDFHSMWPMFGTAMLILAVLPFAVWLLMYVFAGSSVGMPPDFRLFMIEGVAMFAAYRAPSRMYRTWNLHNEGIYYAMLPASKLEKFCSALLFSLIVCPLAVYLGSLLLDVFLTALPFGPWQDWIWQGKMGFPFTLDISSLDNYMIEEGEGFNLFVYYGSLWIVGCWLGYIGAVLMFVFTSTLFKNHKVLWTIFWLYVIEFVISIVLIPVFLALGTGDRMLMVAEWMEQQSPEVFVRTTLWICLGFNVLLIALFGWLSWRRLKRMAY